jgi:crotonobetainyl-CoA:carnitine CoA-transferase CaiB-like acyl-CoA transferase
MLMSIDKSAVAFTNTQADLPFAGLRVLDVSQGLAGPYCGMLLAQYGAQVVKLEPPEGDWSRIIGTRHGSHSAIDYMANRGKKSIAVDLKSEGSIAMVKRIAAQCDVMIESYRPGIAARLGICYADMAQINSKLIYVSVSGFGQTGDKSGMPATDAVIQGFSGMMALNPDASGKPIRLGFLPVDTLTAMYAFQAVSVALYARRDGAGGRHLDISLMQATAAFLTSKIIAASMEGEAPIALNVPAGVYRTQDGWLVITLSKEAHFAALCKATGRDDLALDPRFATFQLRALHARYLEDELGSAVLQRSSAKWLDIFQKHGVLASPINTLTDWLADPHVVASEAASLALDGSLAFHFPATPGMVSPAPHEPRAHWPRVGEHGAQVLRDFGFSEQEVANLQADRTFVQPQ